MPDGTGARSRVPLALGAIVSSRVPQVSGQASADGRQIVRFATSFEHVTCATFL